MPSWPPVWPERRRATHQELELAEGDGGAVEEVGRQPPLVLVTVTDRRPCVQTRDSESGWWLQVLFTLLYSRGWFGLVTTQRAAWTRFPPQRTHREPQNDLGHWKWNTNWNNVVVSLFGILGNEHYQNSHLATEMTFTGRQGAVYSLFRRKTDTWGCEDFSNFCCDCEEESCAQVFWQR